jgi:hypothetical protein
VVDRYVVVVAVTHALCAPTTSASNLRRNYADKPNPRNDPTCGKRPGEHDMSAYFRGRHKWGNSILTSPPVPARTPNSVSPRPITEVTAPEVNNAGALPPGAPFSGPGCDLARLRRWSDHCVQGVPRRLRKRRLPVADAAISIEWSPGADTKRKSPNYGQRWR